MKRDQNRAAWLRQTDGLRDGQDGTRGFAGGSIHDFKEIIIS